MTKTYDAVVVGGGVMGCSILYHLAEMQAGRLLLLERSTIGAGSTGRSSGIIRMHYSTEVNTRMALASQPVFVNWKDAVGHGDSGWTKTGFIVVSDSGFRPTLEKSVAMQQACGVNTSMLSVDEARDIAPHFEIGDDDAVCYEPDSGYGDPSGVADGFLAAARARGAQGRLESPATGVEIADGKVSAVIAGGERIPTGTAILAVGPWSKGFLGSMGIDLPVKCTRHQVIFLRRPVEKLPWHPGGGDMTNLTYFRPEADDLTLVGNGNIEQASDPDNYDTDVSMSYVEDIWSRLARRMPAMADAEYAGGYVGLYTSTPDSHPIIDRVEGIDGLYICTGFSGHGFKLAPAAGRAVAEMVVDGESTTVDIRALMLSRFAEGRENSPQETFKVLV